jgi:hypothetical protein
MMRLCPRATLLNYSNPMSMNMQTVFRTSDIRAVGLCHSVQGTFEQLMRYIEEEPNEVAFICAGINHMAFYLKLEKNGQDLYPRLFQAMENQSIYRTNAVRFELMKRLGHFVTESSEHNAEYCSFFIPHGPEAINKYQVPIDEYLRRCDGIVEEFERLKVFSRSDEPIKEVHASHEYCSAIMKSIVTGEPSVIYGNMPNGGTISNLPRTAIVEAPTLVDRTGLHHAQVGELPPQIVGYIQPHVVQHELFVRAAIEGRRDHVYQACMFDPLTAATLSMDRIVEMCDEMIAAYGDELPKLDKKTLVPTSGKAFPKVDPKVLRESWDRAQAETELDYITSWQVAGPFHSPEKGKVSLGMATPLEADFLKSKDGSVDLSAKYDNGHPGAVAFKKVQTNKRGFVNLTREVAAVEWACAYAYAEVESIHPRDVVLGVGSDDGVKIWLNGKVVHENDTQRAYSAREDAVNVHLDAGVNRIFVKISNARGGWGFGVSVPAANF